MINKKMEWNGIIHKIYMHKILNQQKSQLERILEYLFWYSVT